MTQQQINNFAEKYDNDNAKAEKKVYRMVFAVLNNIVSEYKKMARVNIAVALHETSKINDDIFRQLLSKIYYEIGLVFALSMKNEIDNIKRNPTFEVGFFSELWKQTVMQTIRSTQIAARITNITDVTRKQIREVLFEAQQNRLTAEQTARLINQRATTIVRNRAMLITRTETTLAANMGHAFAASKSKIELDKVWIATKDSRTRDAHRAMDGKRVKGNEKFNVNGHLMEYAGDPNGGAANVCNCRCTVAYVPASVYTSSQNPLVNQIIQAVVVNELVN